VLEEQVALPCVGSEHTVSQPPQWFGLLVVSMHAAPHWVRLEAHVSAHAPRLQTLPVGQAFPQEPQFVGSDSVSTQPESPQLVKPVSQS
jgi:hypothetical protein